MSQHSRSTRPADVVAAVLADIQSSKERLGAVVWDDDAGPLPRAAFEALRQSLEVAQYAAGKAVEAVLGGRLICTARKPPMPVFPRD